MERTDEQPLIRPDCNVHVCLNSNQLVKFGAGIMCVLRIIKICARVEANALNLSSFAISIIWDTMIINANSRDMQGNKVIGTIIYKYKEVQANMCAIRVIVRCSAAANLSRILSEGSPKKFRKAPI